MKRLEGERLILRAFKESDVNQVYDYARRIDVGPKAGWKPHKNKSESLNIIKHFIQKDDVYALVYKENHLVIGSLGIHYTELGSLGKVYELGYVLHPNYHRQGLMKEAIDLALDYFFSFKNHDLIYVGHFIENVPSKKLIHKFPFKWIEDIDYQSKDYGHKKSKIYQLSRTDYAVV